jgi:hypothetical protein
MLDQTQLALLPPVDREKYMALERFFSSAGWKYIKGLAEQRAAEQVQRAAFAASWADNRLAIGAGAAWNELAKLEETETASFERMVKEAAKADETDAVDEEIGWQT